ncbi:MAG: RAD52 family DNA repair protein [Acidobacteria bacterium]|nr:RAD52 family DNA repair protein [Acidobacteriota bacterium]MCA1642309.1 RAD52 family DNA repair protein [Acidobacteriota bacterium]
MTTATANTTTTDRKAMMRDKRAQGIAAMGLVNREGDRFRVTTPSLRGKRASYEVWRNDAGRVCCSCLEFEEMSVEDARFRCEHILAVKHSLLARNTEAVTKQPQPTKPAARAAEHESQGDETPSTEANTASERREGEQAAQAAAQPSLEREQGGRTEMKAQGDTSARVSSLSSLAAYTNTEEQKEMNRKQATAQHAEEELEFVTAEEHEAEANNGSVVPMQFANTLRVLRQPIDPKLIKQREGWRDRNGNQHMVEYVEWHAVADILDRVAPTWSHSVRGIVQIGDMVAITAAITIGDVTREGVGTGTADNETGIKKAEHDALKRAAIKFGIARELYQRESEVIETQGAGPQPGDFPRDPLAKSMNDLVTPKQLGMIRALAREAGVEADEECRQVMRITTEELSKKAASSFIDHLKSLQGAQAQPMRRAS